MWQYLEDIVMAKSQFPLASQAVSIVNGVSGERKRVATAGIFMATVRRGHLRQISLPVRGETASVETFKKIAGLGLVTLDGDHCTFIGGDTVKKHLLKFSLDRNGFLVGGVSAS